jgi:nitric oxide reductase NorD protein
VTHSVYQADFIENTTIAESGELAEQDNFLYYPEWNYRKRQYRDDFCKLFPKFQTASDVDYYHTTIQKYGTILSGLRKQLVNMNNKRQELRRQNDGATFDLDAIIDLYADVVAKRTPSEKIYLSSRKNVKDLSVLLLLDGSLSSDSYVLGNRVIDVEKEVSILFGEILNEFETDFSVAIFYSKTRNYSNYNILKDFNEKWSKARYKIGAAQPNGYTRIGTALRHAGSVLDKRTTKNKWVILLSDGKPNDYDKYEGNYGVQDVKQSLRELYQRNINAYALAIEAQARYYLPQMFGQNHYQILHTPHALLNSMVHLFDRIRFHS